MLLLLHYLYKKLKIKLLKNLYPIIINKILFKMILHKNIIINIKIIKIINPTINNIKIIKRKKCLYPILYHLKHHNFYIALNKILKIKVIY
jgi:hypothetical protein